MAILPVSPLSPEIALARPEGAAQTRLGPIPNVPDGLAGIGGITRVEIPGTSVITGPGLGGLTAPQFPGFAPGPNVVSSPAGVTPLPEVTPFPTSTPTTSVAAPIPTALPTPTGTALP